MDAIRSPLAQQAAADRMVSSLWLIRSACELLKLAAPAVVESVTVSVALDERMGGALSKLAAELSERHNIGIEFSAEDGRCVVRLFRLTQSPERTA
jgi:hypothetical protein